MNLKYLKYLRCFCGSKQFSILQLQNDKLKLITVINEEKIETGLMVCDNCCRWFPIDEGILNMLPDTLANDNNSSFIKRYNIDLPANCCKENIQSLNSLTHDEESIFHKKNEIEARDEQAGVYHTYGYSRHDDNEKKYFLKFLNPTPMDVILELGCGTGRITEEISKKGFYRYIVIDFSGRSLQLLSNRLSDEMRNRILLMKADVCYLPLKSRITDKLLSAQVYEHIPTSNEQNKFIKEVGRVLCDNGLAALTIYNYNLEKRLKRVWQKKGLHAGKIYYENFTSRQLRKMFCAFFKIEKLNGINCYLPWTSRLNSKVQQSLELVLAKSFFNKFLGNILFIGMRKR